MMVSFFWNLMGLLDRTLAYNTINRKQARILIIFLVSLINSSGWGQEKNDRLVTAIEDLFNTYYSDLLKKKGTDYTVCAILDDDDSYRMGGTESSIYDCLNLVGGYSVYLNYFDYPDFISFVEGKIDNYSTADQRWGFSIERLKDNV